MCLVSFCSGAPWCLNSVGGYKWHDVDHVCSLAATVLFIMAKGNLQRLYFRCQPHQRLQCSIGPGECLMCPMHCSIIHSTDSWSFLWRHQTCWRHVRGSWRRHGFRHSTISLKVLLNPEGPCAFVEQQLGKLWPVLSYDQTVGEKGHSLGYISLCMYFSELTISSGVTQLAVVL